MSRQTVHQRQNVCQLCGDEIRHAQVDEPGLCGYCGLRVRQGHLPPADSECALCGERRRRSLMIWAPTEDVICHTCAFFIREMRPRPLDLAGVAQRLKRERRASTRE